MIIAYDRADTASLIPSVCVVRIKVLNASATWSGWYHSGPGIAVQSTDSASTKDKRTRSCGRRAAWRWWLNQTRAVSLGTASIVVQRGTELGGKPVLSDRECPFITPASGPLMAQRSGARVAVPGGWGHKCQSVAGENSQALPCGMALQPLGAPRRRAFLCQLGGEPVDLGEMS